MAINDVLMNFDKEIKQMNTAAEKALYDVGADLLTESNKLTPIDKSNLRKSGKLHIKRQGKRVYAEVSYGDSRVTYAAAVHEINKNYVEPGTGWKYLERPLKQNEKKYISYIRKKVGRVL